MRLSKKDGVLVFINNMLIDYPSPANISYVWNFGSLAGFLLIVQLVSGIFLAMYYVPHVDYAFLSIEYIMRDVNYGWVFRYLHANGASIFFLIVYFHILRGLYYGSYSYPTSRVWLIGVTIYILMMATAFLGYVLPWGQMSLWAATVITNFFSVIPFIGKQVVEWLWGGFSVNNATLNRFFSLHYLIPFLISVFSILHLLALHDYGSRNPVGIKAQPDCFEKVSFHPYFSIKDLLGIIFVTFILLFILFYWPNYLGHPDNYIPANPMATPPHIVPEWYFLPFYAVLRSVPNKALGVLAMAIAILSFYILPMIAPIKIASGHWRPFYRFAFWLFFFNFVLLGWVGGQPVEYPFYQIGQLATFLNFFLLFIVIPFINYCEDIIKGIENDTFLDETS